GGGLAGELAGLHLPGGTAAGHGLVLLSGADLALGHAGVEVPTLVVLARVPLTEVVEVVQPFARLGRARRGGGAAVGPLARLLPRLEVHDIGSRSLVVGAGRLDPHSLEARLVLKGGGHRTKCRVELVAKKGMRCRKGRSPRKFVRNSR